MLLTHGVFGLGALCGPIMVYIFETSSFAVYGLLTLALVPFYFKMESPEKLGLRLEEHCSPLRKDSVVSRPLEYSLCLMLFLYVGMEFIYGGWISSYAVLSGVTDNQGATIFPTIFWIFMTIFRFSLAFQKSSSSQKLKSLLEGNILSGIVCLVFIYLGFVTFTCYVSGFFFGLCMSVIYPIIFTFPLENRLSLEDSQTANIVTAGVLSEGLLTMFVGLLMQWVHINVLFYSISVVAVLMWLLRKYCLHLIEQQKNKVESGLQLELVAAARG
jgi:fucose permease